MSQRPALSLVLCSRNDSYMGNSLWRLETTLNYVAARVRELGRMRDVEVLVADWGSDVPLRDVVKLTPDAAEVVSFLTIPPSVAVPAQGGSSFAEVIALNAAARRARGEYIGRIDQDTLVGARFLETFFDIYEGRRTLSTPPSVTLLYANRREIPFRFVSRCPAARHVERFIRLFGRRLRVLSVPQRPFWTYWVGIWLIHRSLWAECGGYDERLVHYNWMEVDMILRLMTRYALVDLGTLVAFDFYHIEHVHPRMRGPRHVQKNPPMDWTVTPTQFHPNGDNWGLSGLRLESSPVESRAVVRLPGGRGDSLAFAARVAQACLQMGWDRVFKNLDEAARSWRGHILRVRHAVRD